MTSHRLSAAGHQLAAAALLFAAACSSSDPGSTPTASNTRPQGRSQALETVVAHLHDDGSGAEARALIPDLVQTYVDDGHGVQGRLNPVILPYRYFWSESNQATVAICNVGKTLFVCPYRLDRLITTSEFERCEVSPAYAAPETAATPPPSRP